MGDDGKVMNFISEKELEDLRATRGDRPEDGAGVPDRPLFEILEEAKQKKDAEFNERFRNLPPKSLDEDESEFLEAVDKQRKDFEKATEEAELRALTEFQAARAGRTIHVENPAPAPKTESANKITPAVKRKEAPAIRVKVQPKRAKEDARRTENGPGKNVSGSSPRVLDSHESLSRNGDRESSVGKGMGQSNVDLGGNLREGDGWSVGAVGDLRAGGGEGRSLGASSDGNGSGSLLGLGSYGTDDEDEVQFSV